MARRRAGEPHPSVRVHQDMRTRISVQLWSDSMGLAHESLRTPFVIRLSDGTLER